MNRLVASYHAVPNRLVGVGQSSVASCGSQLLRVHSQRASGTVNRTDFGIWICKSIVHTSARVLSTTSRIHPDACDDNSRPKTNHGVYIQHERHMHVGSWKHHTTGVVVRDRSMKWCRRSACARFNSHARVRRVACTFSCTFDVAVRHVCDRSDDVAVRTLCLMFQH